MSVTKVIAVAVIASILSFGAGGYAYHAWLNRDDSSVIIIEKEILGKFLGYVHFLERTVSQCKAL